MVHVHVGGIKFNKANIVYMYLLGTILQDEIFDLLPTSRKRNVYCRKIKNLGFSREELNKVKTPLMTKLLIDEYYNIIHKEVSMGKLPDKNVNKRTNHPMGSKCGYNKDAQRYCWLNFVTCLFDTKDNPEAVTLEFRPHHGTLNFVKIKNWVKLCFAFVNFAENHKKAITSGFWTDKEGTNWPINLSTIVKATYPKTGKFLEEYIIRRKMLFSMDEAGAVEKLEYENDAESIKTLSLREVVIN